MEAKRFLPSLMGIPEECDYAVLKSTSLAGSESTVITRREMVHQKMKFNNPALFRNLDILQGCHSCYRTNEQKQTSIQKWLENVPIVRTEDETSNFSTNNKDSNIYNDKVSKKNKEKSMSDPTNKYFVYENKEIISDNFKKSDGTQSPQNFQQCNKSNINQEDSLIKNNSNTLEKKKTTGHDKEGEYNTLNLDLKTKNDINLKLQVHQDKNVINELQNEFKEINFQDINENYEQVHQNSLWSDDYDKNDLSKCSSKNGFCTPSDYAVTDQNIMNKINSALILNNDILNSVFMKNNSCENKDDHDYETIMLNHHIDDTQSLPDFIGRNSGYSLVSEVYVNDGYDYISESSQSNLSSINSVHSDEEMAYDKNVLGHLTIKVQDEPPLGYCNDSDNFEPDTLDRKPNKLKVNQEVIPCNQQIQDIFADSLERPAQISLKSTGTFKTDNVSINVAQNKNSIRYPLNRTFGSLREIFEAKTKYNHCSHNKTIKSCSPVGSTISLDNEVESQVNVSWRRGKPKLLRPEARQARRQRQPSPPNKTTIKPPVNNETSNDYINSEIGPPLPPRTVKPPLPPKNRSCHHPIHEVHLDVHSFQGKTQISNNTAIQERVINPAAEISPVSSEYEVLESHNIKPHKTNNSCISPNIKSFHEKKLTTLRQNSIIQNRTEDSGYLSTDSNNSDMRTRRDDSVSETDDSFFDGASESGAESIATDSFFFGKFNKYPKVGSNSERTVYSSSEFTGDNNISHITILPP